MLSFNVNIWISLLFIYVLTDKTKPQRLLHNNLHSYSKILSPNDRDLKRPVQKCQKITWEFPYYLNITRSYINEADRIESNMI